VAGGAGGGWRSISIPRIAAVSTTLGGIMAIFRAILILDNAALPDDRSIVQYIASAGAGYYPALTGGWPAIFPNNPGVGTRKFKFLQDDWRFCAMTTVTAARWNESVRMAKTDSATLDN
jgi:hypothetical protein